MKRSHRARNDKRFLVVHGDAYDVVTRYHRWIALLGGLGYDMLIALNGQLNRWRAEFGYGYWSLSAWVKYRVKRAVSFVSGFEEAVSHDCRQRGFDGVICGHIHHAEITDYDDIRYMNCGDWVESCTALVEDERGEFKLIRWADEMNAAAHGAVSDIATAAAARLKLLLVTDAWEPQTNGVVTTLKQVIPHLNRRGVEVAVLHPAQFRTMPLPGYPEIRVALDAWRIGRRIREAQADTIHIATEGPLGIAARAFLARRSIPFCDVAAHQVPRIRLGAHRIAARRSATRFCAGSTRRPSRRSLQRRRTKRELERWGLRHLVVWGRGVDTALFTPRRRTPRDRPSCCTSVASRSKRTSRRFSSLQFDATKVVVGDGPARAELQSRHPNVEWAGYRYGAELAAYYADADVFVFPSRTDTFGLVMLEAMSCGTPVAAFPVTGPVDVVVDGVNGALDVDLGAAVRRALTVDRRGCRGFALQHGWEAIAERMLANQTPIDRGRSNLQTA